MEISKFLFRQEQSFLYEEAESGEANCQKNAILISLTDRLR